MQRLVRVPVASASISSRRCRRSRSASLAAASLAALTLAACASTPTPKPTAPVAAPAPPPPRPVQPAPPQFVATPGLTPEQRVKTALALLGRGQKDQARAEITAFLQAQPGNELGQSLLRQIDEDPHVLLGDKSFSYTIRPGESLSLIAERYLGDRFLFYALARYNNIADPQSAEVGQVIQVPGKARKEPAPRHARSRESDEAVVARRVQGAASTPPAPPPPAAPAHDPRRAHALRAAGLEAMSRGDIERAVGLLQAASKLDPADPLIARDLARALRIDHAVHSKR